MPLIIEACGEKGYSYEYRHGVTSYGALTYALARRLRQKGRITFRALVEQAGKELAELGYKQSPQILGPGVVTRARVPWRR